MTKAILLLCLVVAVCCLSVSCQQDNDDDFDDSGYDNSGYSNSPSRDAEESNQNPSNYSPANEEDLDDDDDVDETHLNSQVSQQQPSSSSRMRQQQQRQYYGNLAPQQFYAPPNSVLLAGFDPAQPAIYSAAASGHQARYRHRRSIGGAMEAEKEKDIEDGQERKEATLSRRKRYAKSKKSYIGPVYTYVKTDKHAHYKWGVKHKVGKHYGR